MRAHHAAAECQVSSRAISLALLPGKRAGLLPLSSNPSLSSRPSCVGHAHQHSG